MKCSELQKVSREDGGAALYIGKRDTNSTQTPCSACIYLLLVIACPFDKQFFLYPCVTFSSSDREYLCLGEWEEDGLLYTYTRRIHNPRHECFVGRVTISSLESTSKPHFRLRGREGFYLQRAGPTVVGDSGWTHLAWSFQREVLKFFICCVLTNSMSRTLRTIRRLCRTQVGGRGQFSDQKLFKCGGFKTFRLGRA